MRGLQPLTALLFVALSARGVSAQPASPEFDLSHGVLDAILRAHVSEAGLVDYAGVAADRASLDAHLARVAAVDQATFGSWSRADQLAFLINAYNAHTIRLILDHWPVDSVRDTAPDGNPWDRFRFALLGREVTLNQIEHEMIRPVYGDARVHFALVCAARSCPPLLARAYRGDDLDAVLDANARAFLTDPRFNDLSDPARPRVSRLFDWYAQDFAAAAGSVAGFIAQHSGVAIPPDAVFTFLDYDWTLNSQ